MQFNRQASLHELEKEFVGGRLHQHHRGAALRVRCGKIMDTQHEQTIIFHHGVRLSTSEPAWPLLVANCCALWQLLATRTEARLLPRARRPGLIF